MNWNIRSDNPSALLVVAHPDDETIFCGGMLLSYPSWNWNIVCVTMQQGTPRPQEFESVMEKYKEFGVNIQSYLTLNKPDLNQDLSTQDYEDWKTSIKLLGLTPEIVFTHNVMGEYGHKHHIAVSKIVNELFSNVWEFVYPGDMNITPQPKKTKINEVNLDKDTIAKKSEIYATLYLSQAYIWNVLPELMKYEFERGVEIFTSA